MPPKAKLGAEISGDSTKFERATAKSMAAADRLKKKLNRLTKGFSPFGSIAKSIGRGFARAFAVIGALVPVASGYFVKLASDAEEMRSKFNVVFGSSAKEVEEWAKTLGEATNRSKTDLMGFAASMQDLLVPMGLAPDRAKDLSKEIVELANDMGSFNNVKTEDVIRDLSAALTGSGETMKKYGVVLTQAAIEQEILSSGIRANKDITATDKALASYNIILRSTKAAHGDAERTADSFSNLFKGMQAEFKEAGIELGNVILETGLLQGAMQKAIPKIREFTASVTQWVEGGGVNRGIAAFKTFVNEIGTSARESASWFKFMAQSFYDIFIDPTVSALQAMGNLWGQIFGAIADRRLPDMESLMQTYKESIDDIIPNIERVWEQHQKRMTKIGADAAAEEYRIREEFNERETKRVEDNAKKLAESAGDALGKGGAGEAKKRDFFELRKIGANVLGTGRDTTEDLNKRQLTIQKSMDSRLKVIADAAQNKKDFIARF